MRKKFETDGFLKVKRVVPLNFIRQLHKKMLEVMGNYVSADDIDQGFQKITGLSKELRGNVYKVFGRFSDLPAILFLPEISRILKKIGFEDFTVQGYSILVMEPNEEKFLFLPHQDLKERLGRESLILWVPLSDGCDIGGLGFAKGIHTVGPIKHVLDKTGHLKVDLEIDNFEKVDVVDFNLGDCVFFSPYLIHWSIKNSGSKCRWTAVVKIDSISKMDWLNKNLHPFIVSEFIDERSNEERLSEAEYGY